MKKTTGVITYYNDTKGYGFLKDTQTNESFFFHCTDITGEPIAGREAEFEVIKSTRRPGELQAAGVVVKANYYE